MSAATNLLSPLASRYQLLPFLLTEARKTANKGKYHPINRKVFGSFHQSLSHRLSLSYSHINSNSDSNSDSDSNLNSNSLPFPSSSSPSSFPISQSSHHQLFLAALNHPKIDSSNIETFFALKQTGKCAVHFLTAEYIHFTFPTATAPQTKQLFISYVSAESLYKIAKAYGIASYYENVEGTSEECSIECMQSLFGLMVKWKGVQEVRRFLFTNLFSIPYYRNLRDGRNPSVRLNTMMKRYGLPCVDHRIVAESGRGDEESSVFVVNAYSGMNLLGQGVGRTLRNAKKNANEVAWQKLTLTPKKDGVSVLSASSKIGWESRFSAFLP